MIKHIVLTAILLSAALASAQRMTPEQRQAAQEAYEAALKHYTAGSFELAAVSFQEAYEISSQPAILYNMAQAYRLANYPEAALSSYKAFLIAVPETTLRPEVEQRIQELGKLIISTIRKENEEAKRLSTIIKWRGPVIGYWTVVKRRYQTDCADVREKDPGELSALVGPRSVRLGECTVPLTESGDLEHQVTCYGPGPYSMSLTSGKFDWQSNTMTLEGKASRPNKFGEQRSCPVTFSVEFKREEYNPLATAVSRGQ
jgi:hypothetical protein